MATNPTLPSGMRENVSLAEYTTLGLGGNARYFFPCSTVDQLREGLEFADERGIPAIPLGGGSNIVARDEGYNGVILKIDLSGISWQEDGTDMIVRAGAGETWDHLVQESVERGLADVECLSGIPGTTGATPIQNVGAYGQEVSDSIFVVEALDCDSMQVVEFSAEECGFGYRQSRFKSIDAGRFIITAVAYRLRVNGRPRITYPELRKALNDEDALQQLESGAPVLRFVRESVIALRRSKGMVIDSADPNTRSAGSFFTNPFVTPEEYHAIEKRWHATGHQTAVPSFASSNGVKIPAAWLVENSGYPKGTRKGGAGISTQHALALVNFGCTTNELLSLAHDIQKAVRGRFGINLEQEPVLV